MDKIILNDLHACVNCLGSLDEGKFVRDVDTNVSIRDILRHLRRESSTCEIRLELNKMNIVAKCLVPLLINYNDDSILFDLIIRLMMNLTQPAIICFKQQLPDDMLMRGAFIKVNEALQGYKTIFANKSILEVLSNCLTNIFAKEWEDRSEEDHMMVERVLILIRNVLHIDLEKEIMDGAWSHHDHLFAAMLDSGWSELIIYISNTEDEHRFAFHTLEIIFNMLKEQTGESMKQISKEVVNEEQDNERLLQLTIIEQDLQRNERASTNVRGLRYDGAFELSNIKSTTGQPMTYHHDLSSGKVDLRRDRILQHKPKHRVLKNEKKCERRSPNLIIERMQRFCKVFLEFGYNTLMSTARNYLVRNQMQPGDETYYLWSLKFFTSVCRISSFKPNFVIETITDEIFYWVYEQVVINMDSADADKKKAHIFYKKIELAIETFNEMLRFLLMLDRHQDEKYKKFSAHIKSNVFYKEEFLDMYPMLLQKYKENIHSILLLHYLIEGSYLVITILQNHKSFDMNVVKRVKKKKKSRKQKAKNTLEEIPISNDTDDLNLVWDRICVTVTAVIKDEIQLNDVSLPCIYDPTLSEKKESIELGGDPIDSQLKKALGLVQIYLRQEKPLLAVAMLRLARTMWPDEDKIALSSEEDSIDQEISMLKRLLLVPKFYQDEDLEIVKNNATEVEKDISNEVEEEETNIEDEFVSNEIIFDLNTYIIKFTESNIVRTYGILFNDFSSNPPLTKSSLLRIMHHIAVKLRLPIAFYNLRIFTAFSDFLKHPLSKTNYYKEERKFVIYMIRLFTKHATENKKLFIEVLFQKKTKHLMSILKGEKYETEDKSQGWTAFLDEELERIFENVKGEEFLRGCDIIDMIMSRFSDPNKTRRQICSRLIIIGLIESLEEIIPKRRRVEQPWSAEEQARLIVLVEEYKNEPNAIKFIMNGMNAGATEPSLVRLRRNVVKKILQLGLVSSKAELGIVKKRGKNKNFEDSDEENVKENSDDDNEDKFVVNREKRVPPPLKVTKIIDWTAFKMTFAKLLPNEQRWFIDLMVENIDTRANGIIGSLALIPLLDEDSAALSSLTMQKLFSICNFLFPNASIGEGFWRIPEDTGYIELDNFRHCSSSLSEADILALTMTEREETLIPQPKSVLREINIHKKDLFGSDSEEEVVENINRRKSKLSDESRSSVETDVEDAVDNVEAKRNIRTIEDSEDDEIDEVRMKNKRRIIDSGDDEENEGVKKRKLIDEESD